MAVPISVTCTTLRNLLGSDNRQCGAVVLPSCLLDAAAQTWNLIFYCLSDCHHQRSAIQPMTANSKRVTVEHYYVHQSYLLWGKTRDCASKPMILTAPFLLSWAGWNQSEADILSSKRVSIAPVKLQERQKWFPLLSWMFTSSLRFGTEVRIEYVRIHKLDNEWEIWINPVRVRVVNRRWDIPHRVRRCVGGRQFIFRFNLEDQMFANIKYSARWRRQSRGMIFQRANLNDVECYMRLCYAWR